MRSLKMTIKDYLIGIKNFFICLRYPFLKVHNRWTDKPYGYSWLEIDALPEGWRKAFGKQLVKDFDKALRKEGILKQFRFTDIKEKYGTLRIYTNMINDDIDYIINKYEFLSMCYCQICGKPVRYVTDSWIGYYCEDCNKKMHGRRLKFKDLPKFYHINEDSTEMQVDIVDTFKIDFIKAWDIAE